MANKNILRPALRYHGGKYMIASWIISHFPDHKVYVEPFAGAASILLRKPRSYAEIYNDLDGEIVNVFKVLRDHGKRLKKMLELTPFSREEYFASYGQTEDPIERARMTIIKSFMGFGSDSIKNKSGFRSNSNRSGTTPAHDWKNYADKISMLTERLGGVVIENLPAEMIIKRFDTPQTLFYIDPPYLHSTRTKAKRYKYEMTDEDHIRLAGQLKSVKGKVIISGYASSLYDELYRDWHREEKMTFADGAKKRKECIWLNFK